MINKQKSSKKSYFFSNVGLRCFRVQKKPCGKSLPLEGGLDRTNENLKLIAFTRGKVQRFPITTLPLLYFDSSTSPLFYANRNHFGMVLMMCSLFIS